MEFYIMSGKIYKIFPIMEKGEKFRKQEFILAVTNHSERGTFVEYIRLQCINRFMSYLTDAEEGDQVVAKFTISGRRMGKGESEQFYTNLNIVDLKIINKTADIEPGKGPKTKDDYADLLPGITHEYAGRDNKTRQSEPEPDDLPF